MRAGAGFILHSYFSLSRGCRLHNIRNFVKRMKLIVYTVDANPFIYRAGTQMIVDVMGIILFCWMMMVKPGLSFKISCSFRTFYSFLFIIC